MTSLDEARSHPSVGRTLYLSIAQHEHFWTGQGIERYLAKGGEQDDKGVFHGPFLAVGGAGALLNVMGEDQLALLGPLVGHTIILERRVGQGPSWYTVGLVARNNPLPALTSL